MVANENEFALVQFQSLRAEILQLVQMQSQLVGVNVVALGALLSVAVQGSRAPVVLIYPLVSLILGLSWLNHAYSICRISQFIARGIEPQRFRQTSGWETYLRTLEPTRFNRIGYWGVRAVFAGGSLLSLLAGLFIGIQGAIAWIAFSISTFITAATLAMFALLREDSHEIAPPSPAIDGS
ncbi:MAG: hypothetical protein ACRDSH_05330 [Pseudonocardiaceae bacterium]